MAALHAPLRVDADNGEDIAAKTLDERDAFAALAHRHSRTDQAVGAQQAIKDLFDQREALLDFVDADPNPRIDVAVLPNGNREAERIIGRVRRSRRASKLRPEARPT